MLIPIKWVSKEEFKKIYPPSEKWPKPTISGRMAMAEELLKAHPGILNVETVFDDAIIFGTSMMKTTVFPDGEIFMYPITHRMELFFEIEYDHGQGD